MGGACVQWAGLASTWSVGKEEEWERVGGGGGTSRSSQLITNVVKELLLQAREQSSKLNPTDGNPLCYQVRILYVVRNAADATRRRLSRTRRDAQFIG